MTLSYVSYKNQLQEWLVKCGNRTHPTYQTNHIGSAADGWQLFESTVTISYDCKTFSASSKSERYYERCTSKKEAECSAAKNMLAFLHETYDAIPADDSDEKDDDTQWFPDNLAGKCGNVSPIVVLVDCDHIAFVNDTFAARFLCAAVDEKDDAKTQTIHFRLYASYGANLPHIKRCAALNNCSLHFAPKPGQDLVDTMMMLDASLLVRDNPDGNVIVVSKDKALYNLEVLLGLRYVGTEADLCRAITLPCLDRSF
jgi:hypothetical protein